MDIGYRCYVVQPKTLKLAERMALAEKIYAQAHAEVFLASDFDEFYKSVFEPHTIQTKIMVYQYNDEVIGYATFQVCEVKKSTGQFYVMMSEMCLKQHFCHHFARPAQFFLKEATKFLISHPAEKVYIVDTLVSPLIYKKTCRISHHIYPTYNKKMPSHLEEITQITAQKLHWNTYKEQDCLVRQVNWKVKKSYTLYDRANDEHKEFYCKVVPNFAQGNGLVIIIPVTFFNITISVIKAMYRYKNYLLEDCKTFFQNGFEVLSKRQHK